MNWRRLPGGVGIDISDKWLRLAQLRRGGDGPELLRYHEEALPAGWVEGGCVREIDALSRRLGQLVRELRLSRQRAVTAIAGRQTYSRTLTLPPMPRRELRAAARLQALTFLPVPPEETVIDIVPGPPPGTENAAGQAVFFIAVRRAPVQALDTVCARAGLKLAAMETEADALHRLAALRYRADPLVLLWLEAGRLLLAVYRGGRPLFMRSLSASRELAFGGDGLPVNFSPLHAFRLELTRALDDCADRHQGLRPDKIILCGAAEQIDLYGDIIAEVGPAATERFQAASVLAPGSAPAPEAGERLLLPLGLACRLL